MIARLLASRRNKAISAGAVVLLIGGFVAGALVAGGDDPPPPTTTTTTTTRPTTTTTEPPKAPLTGLVPSNPALIGRVALVVKVDNVEPKARPQAGVNQADVVYEERVEGSVTRWLAVFHSTDAAPVGPVRSARTSDLGVLLSLNRPYFAWSGANAIFAERIRSSNVSDVGYAASAPNYFRAGDRRAPHNLMLHGTAQMMTIPSPGSTTPPALFTYRGPGATTAHLEPAAGVLINFGTTAGAAPVEYRWNGTGWARTQSGAPHIDAAGQQIAPENVIVQITPYASSGVNDQFGVPIPEAQMVGEGEAWVFTNGGVVMGRWQKPTIEAVTTYTDVDGNPITLTPGRTWVALPPPGGPVRL